MPITPTGMRLPRPARLAVGAGRLVTVLSVLLAAGTVLGLAGLRASGRQVLIVVSGSMTPTFRAGDAVTVRRPAPNDLRAGEIVSFHAPGSARLTTHRIVSLRRVAGGLYLQTKGDANPAPDPDFTPAAAAVGVLDRPLPHLGRWLAFYQAPLGRLTVLGTPLALLLLAQCASLWRGRRPRRRPSEVPAAPVPAGAAGAVGGRLPAATAVAIVCLACLGTGVLLAGRAGATYADGQTVTGNTFGTRTFCASPSSYAATVKAAGPTLYYRLGEAAGATAVDAAPSPHNGTYQGAAALGRSGAIRCDPDTAAGLDGASSYISSTNAVTDPQTFTLEAWFKTTVGGGKIVGFGNSTTGASSNYDRHIYLTNTGQVVFGVYPGAVVTVTSPQTYLDGQWHLVDASLGAAGMTLYLDGVAVASNANKTAQNYTGYWRVGYDNLNGWGATQPTRFYYTGTLDEIAVYPTELTASTISGHYTANHF